MPNNKIRFGVGFDVDKSSLQQLKTQLQEIQHLTQDDIKFNVGTGAQKQLASIRKSALEVEKALNNAFNSDLGTLNVTKFNEELKGLDLNRIARDFNAAGTSGQQAFNNLTTSVLTTNMQLKQTFTVLDKVKTTLSNTLRWNLASGAVNQLAESVQSAFNYVKQLDTQLTDIRVVTGQSREEMANFAVEANKAAAALGRQTRDYTKSYLTFVQQGLGQEESRVRTEAALKAVNITGAQSSQVANDLTAVWNGYQVSTENAVETVDKLAAVADSSASDLSELATGMGKVASVANNMGVGVDQLNAMLATTIATTRQAPETVGNAYKTILTRINDIKTGSEDAEISLGNYSKKMAEVGINVLDANGRLRDTGDVMEEVGNKWSSLTKEQQVYLASTMAGQRQMNNLVALFDNWGQYQDMVNVSMNAAGSLEQKNAIYLEGLTAHMNEFQSSVQGLQDTLIDEDDLKGIYDAGTNIVNLLNNFIKGIGGTHTAVLALASVLGRTFSNEIAGGITKVIQNFQAAQDNAKQLQAELEIIQQFKGIPMAPETSKQLVAWKQQVLDIGNAMSTKDQQVMNSMMQQYNEIENQCLAWENSEKAAEQYYQKITGSSIKTDVSATTDVSQQKLAREETEDNLNQILKARVPYLESAAKYAEKYTQTLNDAIDVDNSLSNSDEKKIKTWNVLQNRVNQILKSARDLRNSDFISNDTDLNRLNEAITKYTAKVREAKKAGEDISSNLEVRDAAEELARAYIEALDGVQRKIQETGETAEGVAKNTGSTVHTQADQAKQSIENALDAGRLKQFVSGITTLTSSVAGAISAFMSLANIPKIWDDENLSSAEKLEQTISAISFALPMLTSNLSSVMGAVQTIRTSVQGAKLTGEAFNLANGFKVLGQAATGAGSAVAAGGEVATASLASVAAAAGIVAAAVAAVVAIVYLLVKAYNHDADAAKKAEAEQRKLANTAKSANDAFRQLKDTITSYSDAVDGLKDLTKGTEEYTAAVEAANEKAQELADSNAELAAKMYRGNDGLLKFRDNALEDYQKQREIENNRIQTSSYLAAQEANNRRATSNVTEAGRAGLGETVTYQTSEGAASYFQGVSEDIINQLVEIFEKNQNITQDDVDHLTGASDALKDSLKDNWDKTTELVESNAQLKATNDALAQKIADNWLQENNTDYQGKNKTEQAAISAMVGRAKENSDTYDKAYAEAYKDAKSKSNIFSDDELHQAYADEMGWQYTADMASDTWGGGKFLDAEGKEQEVSDTIMRQYLAAQKALDVVAGEQSENYKQAEQIVTDLTTAGQTLDAAFQDMDKSFDPETQSIVADLVGLANGDTKLDTLNMLSPDQVEALQQQVADGLLNSISDEDAVMMGYDTAQDFIDGVNAAISEYDPTVYWQGKLKDAEDQVKNLDSILPTMSEGGELDEDQQKALDDIISKHEELNLIRDQGSHEYLDALRDIREQEEDNAKEALQNIRDKRQEEADALKEQIQDLREEQGQYGDEDGKIQVQIDAKTDELEEKMQEIQDADYQIDVKIKADMDSDVADAFDLADEIDGLGKYLTDTLEVTYDQAQEIIAAGNGAMLQNAHKTAEGTIQLDRDTVNSFIDGKQTELEADKQTKIQQLTNQKTALQAQLQTLQARQTALNNAKQAELGDEKNKYLAEAQMLQAQYEAQVDAMNAQLKADDEGNQQIAEGKNELYNALSSQYDTDSQNEQNATDAADKTSATHARNVIAYYQAMHNAVSQYAAQVAVADDGTVTDFNAPSVSGGGTGTNSTNQTAVANNFSSNFTEVEKTISDLTKDMSEADINAAIDQLAKDNQTQIDAINDQIGAIDSGIAALESASTHLDKLQETAGTKAPGSDKSGGNKNKEEEPDTSQTDELDYLEDERDLYHDINIEISDYDTYLNRLEKQQDKLIGSGLLKNLEQQKKLLEQQKDAYARKADIQKTDLAMQQAALSTLGVTFDAYGNISNYMDILAKKQAIVNELTAQYNALVAEFNASTDKDTKDALKDQMDALKDQISDVNEEYKATQEKISNYDKLRDEMQDVEDQIQEIADKEIEIQIEAFNAKIEVSLDLSEAERDWNEFRRKVIDRVPENDALGNARASARDFDSYYKSNGSGIIQQLTDHVNATRDEVQSIVDTGSSEVYGDNLKAAMEDLKKYREELVKNLEDAEEVFNNVHDNVMDSIKNTEEAFDTQEKKYEHINDLIDHDKELIELVYGESDYEAYDKYFEKRHQNGLEQLDFLKKEKEFWEEQMARDTARRDRFEKGSKEWEAINEEVESDYDNVLDATKELNSSTEDMVQNALDRWENAVKRIIKETNDATLSGDFGDYERKRDQWEKTKWHDDRYLDRLTRANELLDIESKINDTINNTNNIKTQQQLAKFRDQELDKLSKIDHLTQADVDYANQKLVVLQKQLALEDAQQAKTQMRLRRDSQGNYTYQYVANEDDVQSKLQEYRQALEDLRNIPKDEIESTYDEIYDYVDEYYEKLAQLAEDHKDDEEGYAEAARDLYDQYYGEEGYITLLAKDGNRYQQEYNEGTYTQLAGFRKTEGEEFTKFLGLDENNADDQSILGALKKLIGDEGEATNMLDIFTNDTAQKKFGQLNENEKKALTQGDDSMKSIWNTALEDMSSKYNEEFIPKVQSGMQKILDQNTQYHDELEQIESAAGISFDEIESGLDKNIGKTEDLIVNNDELIGTYENEADAVREVENGLIALVDAYDQARQAAIDAAQAAYDYWAAVNMGDFDDTVGGDTGGGGGSGGSSEPAPAPSGGSGNQGVDEAAAMGIAQNIWTYGSWANDPVRKNRITEHYGAATAERAQAIVNEYVNSGRASQLVNYDSKKWGYKTGGYTGEWGPEGRPAILHEKEYVLNAQDTPNVLSAVKIARNVIDKVASMNAFALEGLTGTSIPGTYNTTDNSTTQTVEINASFPNANNTAEIEKAFDNLVNMASQRASKNRRSM